MNVLVYSGSEVNPKSLDGTLDLLRSVCLPNYTVQPLTKASFINEPWKVGCALFVLPGLNPGAASSDVDIFGPKEVQKLREFVEQDGGAFLGFGLGARFEEQQGGFEGSLSGLSLGYGGQSYINEADQRAPLRFLDKGTKTSVFPVAGKSTKMESFAESEGSSVKVEAPLVDATLPGAEGQSKNLTVLATSSSSATIAASLQLLNPSAPTDLSPLPQFLTSIPAAEPKPIVTHLLRPFFPDAKAAPDVADTIAFVPLESSGGLPKDETMKHIIVCPDGVLPPKEQTPHFDLSLYYDTLAKLRGAESTTSGAKTTATEGAKTTKTEGAKTTKTDSSGIPKTTKTESGPKSTKTSSTESTKTTTSQLKSNPWFSQPLLERLASAFASPEEVAHPNPLPYLGASKLVFVQYLFALAVCEACRLPEVLGPELGKRVRIKWPNDLYLDLSELGGPRELKKIGGILVNTNFAPGGKVDVVIGCGLNVLNKPPISSLSQLVSHLHAASPEALSLERTAAAIMISFERLWTKFTSAGGSFEPFLQAYYAVWLHTDQRVTVTTTVPPTKARIGGDGGWDDRTYGRFGGKEYIDLQPDGNSFDLMANLIKAKTT
ncbi:hypothetical protein DFP72DRAFT_908608 [Ephemerocybe angulata]|uniref:BPL/LPL catalytic domain-containing protein n=1 Tax=Ephemerocybe angulata TaxID=980116 RepID=A0A8H6M0Q6_9AGAR|nr:hypothetical protein DFP72DRAFT_908608 [Tulosesus angulatus]